MDSTPLFSAPAALIGDPARAAMLLAMMNGQALTASELALDARVTPQTASGHLAKLVDGRLVAVERQGRHRYYRLQSAKVAQALETLIELSIDGPPRYRPPGPRDAAMRQARTCYDHLAGRLGVLLTDHLRNNGYIVENDENFDLTESGRNALAGLGLDVDAMVSAKRAFARRCLDWSERRPHLGGALGAGLLAHCEAAGWVKRARDSRAVLVTPLGREKFSALVGPEFERSFAL